MGLTWNFYIGDVRLKSLLTTLLWRRCQLTNHYSALSFFPWLVIRN